MSEFEDFDLAEKLLEKAVNEYIKHCLPPKKEKRDEYINEINQFCTKHSHVFIIFLSLCTEHLASKRLSKPQLKNLDSVADEMNKLACFLTGNTKRLFSVSKELSDFVKKELHLGYQENYEQTQEPDST